MLLKEYFILRRDKDLWRSLDMHSCTSERESLLSFRSRVRIPPGPLILYKATRFINVRPTHPLGMKKYISIGVALVAGIIAMIIILTKIPLDEVIQRFSGAPLQPTSSCLSPSCSHMLGAGNSWYDHSTEKALACGIFFGTEWSATEWVMLLQQQKLAENPYAQDY